jgi:hypothetical protein
LNPTLICSGLLDNQFSPDAKTWKLCSLQYGVVKQGAFLVRTLFIAS